MTLVRCVLVLLAVCSRADRLRPATTTRSSFPARQAATTYAKKYDGWRRSFVSALRDKFGYPDDHVIALAEKEEPGVAASHA